MNYSATAIALIGALGAASGQCAPSAPSAPGAENFDPGHFLQTQCTRCHDDGVYTRPNRRINSLPALDAQVRRCDANIGTSLFDEDLEKVVEYLNTEYYGFEKK